MKISFQTICLIFHCSPSSENHLSLCIISRCIVQRLESNYSLSNLLRHGQIPSLHHSHLKIAMSNERRDSALLDPSFVQGKDLHGHLSVTPTYLCFLGKDTCTYWSEGSEHRLNTQDARGLKKCGGWLNLWVKLAKKYIIPKVLSFSLF